MTLKLREQWDQLRDRDRKMLMGGGVICFFYLFYVLLYAPLAHAVVESREQLIEKKATYAWMKQVRTRAHPGQTVELLDAGHLLTVFSNQLHAVSFRHSPYQLEQAGASTIQLSFEAVPYNASLQWLSTMSQQYAFSIKQFQVDKTDTAGVVKLFLVIDVD